MLVEGWSKDKSRNSHGAFGFEGVASAQDGSTTGQMIQMLDKHMRTEIEPGEIRVMIGASSKDIRLAVMLQAK